MKPHILKISAFGPFKNQVVLDFGCLKNHSLFLIHGRTGAGKTTILDAMTYALYGGFSGHNRDIKFVRSHHADENTPTEVEFEFSIGQKRFKIYRRADLKGENSGKKDRKGFKAEVWLKELKGDSWQVKATQQTEVNRQIESLMRFKVDQFRQVIMLPQGEFLKLLYADSKERESILEVLFETHRFSAIENVLREKAKSLQDKIYVQANLLGSILQQAEAESERELNEIIQEKKNALNELVRIIEALRKDVTLQKLEVKQAEAVLSKFLEYDSALAELSKIEELSGVFQEKREKYKAAHRAAALIPKEQHLLTIQKETNERKAATTKARHEKEKLEKELNSSKRLYEEVKAQFGTIDNWKLDLVNTDRLIQKLEILNGHDRILKSKQKDHKLAATRHKQLQQNQLDLRQRLDNDLETQSQNLLVAEKMPFLQSEFDRCTGILVDLDQLGKLSSKTALLRDDILNLDQEFESVIRQENECGQVIRTLESERLSGQAAVLASRLQLGEPCPVCGSLDHPNPAHHTTEVPNDKIIDSHLQELQIIKERSTRLQSRIQERRMELTKITALSDVITERLSTSNKDEDEIRRTLKEIQSRLEHARKAADILPGMTKNIAKLRSELSDIDNLLPDVQKAQEEAFGALQQLEGVILSTRLELPDKCPTIAELQTHRTSLAEKIASVEIGYRAAEQNLLEASEAFTKVSATQQLYQQQLEEVSEKMSELETVFDIDVRRAGFRDRQTFDQSKLSQAEMENLDQEIRNYENRKHAGNDRLTRARTGIETLTRPDLSGVQQHLSETEKMLESKIAEQSTTETNLESLNRLMENHKRGSKRLADYEHRHGIIHHLSETARGTQSRISFQRFVLGSLLDDVLASATQRLRLMTNGRYTLRRSSVILDRRSTAGLDLEVDDAYTGKSRSVKTLSGGEGFLTSLSLALGLADVVQAYAGGIQLETIFVDEGFGSLDAEALDLAMKALIDLQKNGRLVGIISHIGDLRERIDAALEVNIGKDGSTAAFVV